MPKIKTNRDSAEKIANMIGKSVVDVKTATQKSISTDSYTSVTEVSTAKKVNDSKKQLSSRFESEVKKMIQNVRSVAKNFEVTDKEFKNQFKKIKKG